MHKPAYGPCQSSTRDDETADVELTRILTQIVGYFAVVASVITMLAAYSMPSPDSFYILKVGSFALLACALLGCLAIGWAANAANNTVRHIYDSVFRRLIQTGAQAVQELPGQGPFSGIAGLIGDMAMYARKLGAERASNKRDKAVLSHALETGRQQAQHVASQIRQDAGSLAEAAAEIDFITEHRAREMAEAVQSLDLAEAGVDSAISRLAGLTGSVRSITASADQMTAVIVVLSRLTHSAQEQVAKSDEKTTALTAALHEIEHALQVASTPAYPVSTGVTTDGSAPLLASASIIRQLIDQTADADRRIVEISSLVLRMRELGRAIEHAVQQQGNDINQALDDIYEARQGIFKLTTNINSVAGSSCPKQDLTESLRLTASRLPNRAENLASLLRSLPECVALSEY